MKMQDLIKHQSEQIAELIRLVKLPSNVVQLSHQNKKGGSQKGQKKRTLNQQKKEDLEFMRDKEKNLAKNVRYRQDGRFEWQKMIGGVWHREIDSNYKRLKMKIADHERELKHILRHAAFKRRFCKDSPILFDLCKQYVELNKAGIKSTGSYEGVLNNHLIKLNKPIDTYDKNGIVKFLNETGSKKLCYYVLKNVFAEATEAGIIERNIIATLKKPEVDSVDGRWFTIDEQKLIHKHKHETDIADEIDFFLMVGCRLSEAHKAKPDFERNSVYVTRTKKDGTSGWVKISQTYCKTLKKKWSKMFKFAASTISRKFTDFLKKLGIKYEDTCLHSLRHTFCSNLFYLKVNDRTRQYLMGHKTSKMTSETYTTYDPNVTTQDILEMYNPKTIEYPDFDNTTARLAS